jgi:hypothetical protein
VSRSLLGIFDASIADASIEEPSRSDRTNWFITAATIPCRAQPLGKLRVD